MVADIVKSFGFDGKRAEQVLDSVSITTNKQVIPDDPNPPLKPSGIRLGTPAATTRNMKEQEMERIGLWIAKTLKNHDNERVLAGIKKEVEELCLTFPVPGLPIAE
jgi:glycine hydroxymethyltransferase